VRTDLCVYVFCTFPAAVDVDCGVVGRTLRAGGIEVAKHVPRAE